LQLQISGLTVAIVLLRSRRLAGHADTSGNYAACDTRKSVLRYFQPFTTPDALDTLVVDAPALMT
jgi:hypothetical protein